MNAGADIHVRRATVCRFLHGDWRFSTIVIFIAPGVDITLELKRAFLLVMVTFITWFFCGHHPRVWNSNRWGTADMAVDAIGGMEMCHFLHSRTMRRFMLHFLPKRIRTQVAAIEDADRVNAIMDELEREDAAAEEKQALASVSSGHSAAFDGINWARETSQQTHQNNSVNSE